MRRKYKPIKIGSTIALAAALAFNVANLLRSTPVAAQSVTPASSATFTGEEIKRIQAHGPWPQPIPKDASNVLSDQRWAQKLGETLFFDTSLSHQNRFSCASCHKPEVAFTDNRAVAVGTETGVRNTQSLLDTGLQHWFGWDGGADSLWAASIRPMLASHEMAGNVAEIATALRNNDEFMGTFQNNVTYLQNHELLPFSTTHNEYPLSAITDEETVVLAAKSIAAYTGTLRSPPTPFDQFRNALIANDRDAQHAYPEPARRGLKLFIGEANCRVCHFGANFSNGEFHDTGRPFFTGVGQVDAGRYTGIQRVQSDPYNLLGEFANSASNSSKARTQNVKLTQSNWGQWRTPSLRNLAFTAPYMHDGSLKTLRDVVDAYADIDPDRLHAAGESILKPLALNHQQREDLVAFLLTLSARD